MLCRVEEGRAVRGGLIFRLVFIIVQNEDEARFPMSNTTMTVRVSGALSEFVAANVGPDGPFENISEYVRDLIRRDKERLEQLAFERLKAELTLAFSAPDSAYQPLTAAEVIARNQG
jgi:antitoxin ParD1/3/4